MNGRHLPYAISSRDGRHRARHALERIVTLEVRRLEQRQALARAEAAPPRADRPAI